MYKSLAAFFTLVCVFASLDLFANCCCCQSAEIYLGWRRDDLNWKTPGLYSSHICGEADSHIHFKDIDAYTISGKLKWVGERYYIRLSGEYGLTDKGRARQHFQIDSPWLYYPFDVHTSDPVKRRSEVYDFDIAVGYPFAFCCCRGSFVPLIGFSYHRQHLRVKEKEYSSFPCCSSSSCCTLGPNTYCSYDSPLSSYDSYSSSYGYSGSSSFFDCHSSSDFELSSCNPFVGSPSSDPFQKTSYSSYYNIASQLGLYNYHRTDNYRFTWYGFYLGADFAYALDCTWTVFAEFEGHFLNNCHRKRKSWTGVYFVDNYHKKGWAYGFNSVYGLTFQMCDCWYSTITIDYKWWKAHSIRDELHWQSVGVKWGLGYVF